MSKRNGKLMVLKNMSAAIKVSIRNNNPKSMQSENSIDEYRSMVFTNMANNQALLFVFRGELERSFGSFFRGCGIRLRKIELKLNPMSRYVLSRDLAQ